MKLFRCVMMLCCGVSIFIFPMEETQPISKAKEPTIVVKTRYLKKKTRILYSATYQLPAQKGLVLVSFPYFKYKDRFSKPSSKVIVDRHKERTVLVKAVIDKALISCEKYDVDTYCKDGEYKIETPWGDDSTKDMDHFREAERYDIIRGNGSRLGICIDTQGEYSITVPFDADIEVDLAWGDVEYACTEYPTKLFVEASKVNRWGDSGKYTSKKQSWQYYEFYRSDVDPITKLVTKKGVGFVPKLQKRPERIQWHEQQLNY